MKHISIIFKHQVATSIKIGGVEEKHNFSA
jgi:hypothetical protein